MLDDWYCLQKNTVSLSTESTKNKLATIKSGDFQVWDSWSWDKVKFNSTLSVTLVLQQRMSLKWNTCHGALKCLLEHQLPVPLSISWVTVKVTQSCPTLCNPMDYTVREGNGTPFQYSCLETPMEHGGPQSMGSLKVGHSWATSLSLFTFMHWRRKWQPTPVFLPGESQGRGSLVGCRLWGRTESDTTKVT